jgi:hypothetical protein
LSDAFLSIINNFFASAEPYVLLEDFSSLYYSSSGSESELVSVKSIPAGANISLTFSINLSTVVESEIFICLLEKPFIAVFLSFLNNYTNNVRLFY